MRLSPIVSFSILLLALFAAPVPAKAAPQILGLVASTGPVPLTCKNGTCSVEVSAVCLQEHRKAPVSGTTYKMVKGSQLTLTVTDTSGQTRSVNVADKAGLRSLRVFTSVSVSLPERVIRDLGGDIKTASLTVGPLSSALPVPVAGDKNPLTQGEIAAFTGHARHVAEGVIGLGTDKQQAAGILNQMVNWLPADNSAGVERIAGLRQQIVVPAEQAKKLKTTRLVDRVLRTCREIMRIERAPHLRACLSNQHDILSTETTHKIWRALKPGS